MALVVNASAPPRPVDLADGRILPPGRRVDVDLTDPHHRALATAGHLLEVAPAEEHRSEPASTVAEPAKHPHRRSREARQ